MQFTIIGGKGQKHEVEAIATCVPGLLLTEDLRCIGQKGGKKWHVTHAGTTQKLTGAPLYKSHAALIAGAIGGLPIDWTQPTADSIYKQATAIIDLPLRHWVTRTLRAA